jgi:hypothetical protein
VRRNEVASQLIEPQRASLSRCDDLAIHLEGYGIDAFHVALFAAISTDVTFPRWWRGASKRGVEVSPYLRDAVENSDPACVVVAVDLAETLDSPCRGVLRRNACRENERFLIPAARFSRDQPLRNRTAPVLNS